MNRLTCNDNALVREYIGAMKRIGTKLKHPFTRNLIRLRKEKGWTQLELAEKADVSNSTVRDIEAGYSRGRMPTKARLAKALGANVDEMEIDTERHTLLTPLSKDQLDAFYRAMRDAISDECAVMIQGKDAEIERLSSAAGELKEHNRALEAAIASVPRDVIAAWKSAPPLLRQVAFSFLTGDPSHIESLANGDRSEATRLLLSLGLRKPSR